MNTEKSILIKELDINIEKIQLPALNKDEKSCIEFFVEITRHIQEIDQLFRVFRVNIKNMLYYYELNINDIITRKIDFEFQESDDIIINAFTINCLSSGKTLIESIENFIKDNIGEDSEIYKTFKIECLNKIYDDTFSYRLLIRMRDFSQHGHLPVSVALDNRCSFDLEQILLAPHFNHNKKLQIEMQNIKKEVCIKYSDHPRIAFTMSIAEFNLCIIEIYMKFLNTIEGILCNSIKEITELLNNRSDIIYKSDDYLNGFVLYDICGDSIHCFNPKDDSMKMFLDIKENVSKILEQEKRELKLLSDIF